MAVLQKIRNKAGLLIGVLGVALLAFILSDLFTSSNTFFQRAKDKAFVVDGNVVGTQSYQQRIDQYNAFQEMIYGQAPSGDNVNAQNQEKVYREMVEEMMLDEEAGKLGLTVTPNELSDLVYGANVSPLFFYDQEIGRAFVNPQTGQFDHGLLAQFLSYLHTDQSTMAAEQRAYFNRIATGWSYIENRIKYQRLKEKYVSLVGSTFLINDEEVKIAYNDGKNIADFDYAVKPYSSVSDSSVQVTDAEIKALYDKRKKNFKLNTELRKISYFVKDVIPSDADNAVVKKEIDEATESLQTSANPVAVVGQYSSEPYKDVYFSLPTLSAEARNLVQTGKIGDVAGPFFISQSYRSYKFLDKTVAPDSIRMQRILIPGGFDQKVTDNIADSLLNVINKGKDFATLADELAPGSNGGDLGWVTEYQLSSLDIQKTCFEAETGKTFKLPVRGETWLVRISEKTKPVTKVKVASIVIPVVVSDRTQNAIDNELNQFITENGNLQKFNKAAEAKGYGLVPDAMLMPSYIALDQINGTRNIIHWAFNNKVGEVSKFDVGNDKKIVAIIDSKIESEYMPLSEQNLSQMLKNELIRDKKAEKIISDLKAKNLNTLGAYASAMDAKEETVDYVTFNTPQLSFGYEPVFNVYAKVGKQGQLTAPLKGEAGVYVLNVKNITTDEKEFNADEVKAKLAQDVSFRQLRQATLYVLQEKMNVVDNRYKFW